jgi:hypothetical protein
MGITTPARLDYEAPTKGPRFRRYALVFLLLALSLGIAGVFMFGPAVMQWWQAQRNNQTRFNWLAPPDMEVIPSQLLQNASSPIIVHGRRNANGLRMVTLIVHKQGLIATVVDLGGTVNGANSHIVPRDPSLRYYSPYVDPQDKSRFTIRYELRGEHGVIDGKLHDDERVRFSFRTGPLAQRSTTLPSSSE